MPSSLDDQVFTSKKCLNLNDSNALTSQIKPNITSLSVCHYVTLRSVSSNSRSCGITWWQWLSAKPNGRRPRRTCWGVCVGHTQPGHDFGMVGMAVVDKIKRCGALPSECDPRKLSADTWIDCMSTTSIPHA